MSEIPSFPARYARFGNFQIDLQREEVFQDGQRVKIQGQVYRALLLLLSRAGEIVSREEVRKYLWPEVFLTNLDANVNTTMNKLRQVLGDAPDTPRYIETMPRRGYTFIAPIEFTERPAVETVALIDSASEVPLSSGLASLFARKFRSVLHVAGFLIAGMLLGALLTFVWFFAQTKHRKTTETGKTSAALSVQDSLTTTIS